MQARRCCVCITVLSAKAPGPESGLKRDERRGLFRLAGPQFVDVAQGGIREHLAMAARLRVGGLPSKASGWAASAAARSSAYRARRGRNRATARTASEGVLCLIDRAVQVLQQPGEPRRDVERAAPAALQNLTVIVALALDLRRGRCGRCRRRTDAGSRSTNGQAPP